MGWLCIVKGIYFPRLLQLEMQKWPNSRQWDLSRSCQVRLLGKFWNGQMKQVCFLGLLSFLSLHQYMDPGLDVQQPCCHNGRWTMRMKPGGAENVIAQLPSSMTTLHSSPALATLGCLLEWERWNPMCKATISTVFCYLQMNTFLIFYMTFPYKTPRMRAKNLDSNLLWPWIVYHYLLLKFKVWGSYQEIFKVPFNMSIWWF